MSTPEFLRFTPQEIPGVVIVNAFAILSTLALLTVAFRVVWLARAKLFFTTVLGNYAACLLVANLVTGAAGLMSLQQLLKGGIQEGKFCTFQAILMQAGNFANSYFTVAIGIHTFNSLALARRQSTLICVITVVVGWLGAGVLAAAPLLQKLDKGAPYGISGLSCGIRGVYSEDMFFFHLLPILLTSIISALLYSLIFLVLRGTLVIRGGLKLSLDPNERWGGNVQNYHRFVARIARSMLWFPIAYIFLLVPYSVTRLIDLSGRVCPFPLLVAAYVCWFTLGVANVLTLYNTFRVLGPAFDARSTSQKDLESAGTATSGTRAAAVLPPMIAAGDRFSYRTSTSMSEKSSRPNSLSSFNQVQPAPSENQFRLQAPPLAARIQERREDYTAYAGSTHTRTDSQRSNLYEYGGPTQQPTRLSALLLNEPTVSGVPTRVRSIRRLPPQQQSPMQSLPAPPRPVKRQVTARRPVTMSEPGSPHGSIEVHYSSTADNERPEGYMPRGLVSAVGNSYAVPPIPSTDDIPVRGGSVDISRSRSAQASGQRVQRLSDPRTTRLSTPEPHPPKF
ncbi:hypothetical protein C8F01DRAFT_1028968 [Mycena amicta]|nr:hypothetical protein C8F01DRAFT_1028968 [Mycena amicta]